MTPELDDSSRDHFNRDDLQAALKHMAQQQAVPDPHTVLAGAEARAGSLGRRRRILGAAAVAAAIIAVAGASALLNGGDEPLGQIEPAVPDDSNADGYGIIDGEPQPFMDGLRLVDAETIESGRDGTIQLDDISADEPLYAVAWCAIPSGGDSGGDRALQNVITIETSNSGASIPCLDRSEDLNQADVAYPVSTDGTYVVSNGSDDAAVIAFYDEPSREDYPFPGVDPAPFRAADPGVMVIDSTTPPGRAEDIDAIPDGSRIFRSSFSITDEMAVLTMELNEPGQLLVALDGVVVTNDGEGIPGQSEDEDTWNDPRLRNGYIAAFGPPRQKTVTFSRSQLESMGVDVDDGEFTVTAYPLGFVGDSAWRVTYSNDTQSENAGEDSLPLQSDSSSFPNFAFGHRLIGSYEVPSDGVSRYVVRTPTAVDTTTWVVDCSGIDIGGGEWLEPKVGTVTTPVSVGDLQCLSDQGWNTPLRPYDMREAAKSVEGTQLAARYTDDDEPLTVAAYSPMTFEAFPFDGGADVLGFADGSDVGGQMKATELKVLTLEDLEADGSIVFDVPDSRENELYFTTSGKGRFWLESADPSEGALTPSGRSAYPGTATFGLDDYWTSWTTAEVTWPILARTDNGAVPERMRLRVEGYDDGTFEMRAFGEFRIDEQP